MSSTTGNEYCKQRIKYRLTNSLILLSCSLKLPSFLNLITEFLRLFVFRDNRDSESLNPKGMNYKTLPQPSALCEKVEKRITMGLGLAKEDPADSC